MSSRVCEVSIPLTHRQLPGCLGIQEAVYSYKRTDYTCDACASDCQEVHCMVVEGEYVELCSAACLTTLKRVWRSGRTWKQALRRRARRLF